MCLYAADLQRCGHRVDKAMVHPTALDEAASSLEPSVEMIVVDAVFPFGMIRRLQEITSLPVLVGGHNALQHMLRGSADFAIVGPGRAPLFAFVSGQNPSEIPGLWWRTEAGQLDCGGALSIAGRSLAAELDPFEPDDDWDYFGPPRAPGSNRRIPSIVADFGCVWNRSILESEGTFSPFQEVRSRLPDVAMTSAAQSVIQEHFIDQEGGCSFCVLRYSRRTSDKNTDVLSSLVTQARRHIEAGAHGLSLQTEHPLPFLVALLDQLSEAGLTDSLDEIHIRTIPWLLLRHEEQLIAAIERGREFRVQIVLAQVGFEAFDPFSMELFHKGLSAAENRAAARLLSRLDEKYQPHFVGTTGHGFIPFHPWTRPGDLRTNIEACREDAPWLLPAISPERRVELYAEWSPLFWKAEDEGLLRTSPEGFGWDWEFKDSGTGEIVSTARSVIASHGGLPAGGAVEVLEEVLTIWESGLSPAERRGRYVTLHGPRALRGGP